MSTRAAQFEILASGLQYNADLVTVPYVTFFAAGTDDPKAAWDDKDKASAITKKALDTQGRAEVFGDGVYKLKFYTGDPDAAAPLTGVLLFEIDDYKVQATTFGVRSVVGATTVTPDDDLILCNGDFTVDLDPLANFEHPITLMNIGTDDIIVFDPDGAETIGGAASLSLQPGEVRTIFPDVDGNTWRISRGIGQTYANAAGGFPWVASGQFNYPSAIANRASETIGPTGSGATNIWTALDDIPEDVDWIELNITIQCTADGNARTLEGLVGVRGGADATLSEEVLRVVGYAVASGSILASDTVTVPVVSRVFGLYYHSIIFATTSTMTAGGLLRLTGYGYNR